jgi:hypothetical protein
MTSQFKRLLAYVGNQSDGSQVEVSPSDPPQPLHIFSYYDGPRSQMYRSLPQPPASAAILSLEPSWTTSEPAASGLPVPGPAGGQVERVDQGNVVPCTRAPGCSKYKGHRGRCGLKAPQNRSGAAINPGQQLQQQQSSARGVVAAFTAAPQPPRESNVTKEIETEKAIHRKGSGGARCKDVQGPSRRFDSSLAFPGAQHMDNTAYMRTQEPSKPRGSNTALPPPLAGVRQKRSAPRVPWVPSAGGGIGRAGAAGDETKAAVRQCLKDLRCSRAGGHSGLCSLTKQDKEKEKEENEPKAAVKQCLKDLRCTRAGGHSGRCKVSEQEKEKERQREWQDRQAAEALEILGATKKRQAPALPTKQAVVAPALRTAVQKKKPRTSSLDSLPPSTQPQRQQQPNLPVASSAQAPLAAPAPFAPASALIDTSSVDPGDLGSVYRATRAVLERCVLDGADRDVRPRCTFW